MDLLLRKCLDIRQTGGLPDPVHLRPTTRSFLLGEKIVENELWLDHRQQKMSARWPDFQDVLRVDNLHKPAALDMRMGRGIPMGPEPSRPAGGVTSDTVAGGVTSDTVGRLCEQGHIREAVEALGVLVETGSLIATSLFYAVLQKCVGKKDLVLGRCVHGLSVRSGYEADTFLCNHILRMYASHARLQEAMDVFTMVATPDAFTWSAIISAHVAHGQDKQAIQLYQRMRRSSVRADGHVFVAALQACARGADLKSGQQVHADVLASGAEPHLFVWNGLVDMYAKCGSLEEAQRVFDGLRKKDVVTWNAIISGYSQQGMGEEAFCLYRAMQECSMVAPNSVTFVSLLQACASVGALALEKGKQLHAQIRDRGLQADVFVGSSLVTMYAKCGCLDNARDAFDCLREKNVVTWSAMIAGYSQHGMGQEALQVYNEMQEDGIVVPNSVTFMCLLQACGMVGPPALEKGKQLHAQIRQQGLQGDMSVSNSLVTMYAKCGSLEDAQSLFHGLIEKDVVTWNAMIAGYSQNGLGLEALDLYRAMQEESTAVPDSVTFVCLLQACANVAALHLGRQLHAQIKERGLQAHVFVASSLIDMYANCGSMVDAQQVFDALPEKDDITWNALIAGYTCQGHSDEVFDLVRRMRGHGIQPAGITFICVLTVCSHVGLVKKGREYFEAMSRHYGISPTVEHYTCMVDILGRAGLVDEALALVRTMPVQPDAAMWSTMLSACRKWSNVEVARHAFEEAVKLDKQDAGSYVLMSTIYAGAEMWEKAQETQARRIGSGAWKQPGQSWWTDMDGLVHGFFVGDKMHTGREARLKQVFPVQSFSLGDKKPLGGKRG